MFSLFKFVSFIVKEFVNLLHIDRNALKRVPDPTKYLSMIMLSCFWCLAFGLYFGELVTIGYNMIGHIAILTMAMVTWRTFRNFETPNERGLNHLRQPDRSSRCDEYTDEQREELSKLNSAPKFLLQ
jgi:hypothetical protein